MSDRKEISMKRLVHALVVAFVSAALSAAPLAKLTDVEGIGPANAEKLTKAGVKTPSELLAAGGTSAGRKKLSEQTGISTDQLLKWVNRVDLSRVKGIGTQYSDLLEAAGVDTPKELARRNPDNLLETLKKTNDEKKLVRQLPTKAQVEGWIASAKTLKPAAD
jgi:predicted flap endonuclease-1-like 5' DNA nuclease